MASLNWLNDFTDKTFGFIQLMQEEEYKYFRYSQQGDIYNSSTNWGLGQLVFAAKIIYMLDARNRLTQSQFSNLITSIKKFEYENSYIYDPLVSECTLKSRIKNFIKTLNLEHFANEPVKRAETRQATAALLCLDSKPDGPFIKIPYNITEIEKYLCRLFWEKPWHAGSHFSHLLFFYKTNRDLFDYKTSLTYELIQYAINWVDRLQSRTDGAWYKGNVSLAEKINGAMKILTGFSAVDHYQIKYVEQLIDTCLEGISDAHACDNFNIVFVLFYCSRITDYRKEEIEKFFLDRLELYNHYYYPELGGFSFYKNKANETYYGAKISQGLDEPDIHGTMMFTWGISLISNVIDLGFKLKIPIT